MTASTAVLFSLDMKKLLYFACTICMTAFFAACGQTGKGDATDSVAADTLDSVADTIREFKVRKFVFKDSLPDEQTGEISSYTVKIDLPEGPAGLVKGISRWINEMLGASKADSIDTSDKGMKQLAQNFYDSEDEFFPGSSFEESFTMVYEDSLYVTYELEGYIYTGGAHGMPCHFGMTFDRETGKPISDELLTSTEGLDSIIMKHLVGYFEDCGEEEVDLNEILFENVIEEFPLPEESPWIVADGVKFIYGAYEIAPYAAGMPECTISMKEMEPFMKKKEEKTEK